MERRYGYKEPSYRHGDATNSSRSAGAETMDRTLRTEILSNAQRRYEAAAKELWLRTQAEARAQVRALAQPHEQQRVYAQQSYSSRVPRQEWAPSQNRSVIYPKAQAQVGTSRPSNYLSPPPVPRAPAYEPAPSPSTSNPILYRFRQVPSKPSPKPESDKIHAEQDLPVEELKRRYYEQLSNQDYSQTRLYGELSRSRSTLGFNMHMQYAQGSSAGAPFRTMADEYLDYYMPARRGPQSSLTYQRQSQEAVLKQAERRAAEVRYRRRELEHRARRYNPDVDQRCELSEPEPPIQRSLSEQPERIPRGDKEPSTQPGPSKAKLAFLLNPSEPEDRRTSPSSKTGEDSRFTHRQESESGKFLMREKSDSYQNRWACRTDPERADEASSEHTRLNSQSSASGIPTKRKHSPLPYSSRHSEVSDEDRDEAPRAKRRTFGRLPREYDDNSSDLGPEEEERDENYEARLSRSSETSSGRVPSPSNGEADRPRSSIRHHHNFAHSATGTSKDSEAIVNNASERQSSPTPSNDGSKKYHFRPRGKALSR